MIEAAFLLLDVRKGRRVSERRRREKEELMIQACTGQRPPAPQWPTLKRHQHADTTIRRAIPTDVARIARNGTNQVR